MRKLLLGACVLATVIGAGAAFASRVHVTATEDATVKISSPTGHGSGVHIGDGYIITAAHVVDDADSFSVKTRSGSESKATIILSDSGADVALLRDDEIAGTVPAARLSCRTASVGEHVRSIGNPGEFEFISTYGRISGAPREFPPNWRSAFVVDLTVHTGASGGPVFDNSNEIVGILVGGVTINSATIGYSFVVPSSEVCRLMGRGA